MTRLKVKKYNMMLLEKQRKHQHYYRAKLINMNMNIKEALPPDQSKIIEQAKVYFLSFRKRFSETKTTKRIEG